VTGATFAALLFVGVFVGFWLGVLAAYESNPHMEDCGAGLAGVLGGILGVCAVILLDKLF